MASQTIKGLTVQISGDTTKLRTAVKDAENKSKSLGKELSEVNKLLKEPDANAVELLAQKQQILTERISATKEKLDTLKAAQASVQAQFDKGDITAEQYRAFQREIQYTANEMQGYEKAIQQTTKQLVEAKVKTGEEASSLDMLKAKISLQEQELSKLTNQYKSAVIAEGENSDKAKELKAQYDALNSKLGESKQKMNEAETAAASLGKSESAAVTPLDTLKKSISEQEKELDRLNTEYQNAVVQYGKNSTKAKTLASQIKTLSSEHQNQKAKLQDAEKAAKDITATEKTLTERYQEQKNELNALKTQYTNAVAQYGKHSTAAKNLAKQISSLSGELDKKEKKIQTAEKSADKFDKTLSDTSKHANNASDNVKNLGNSAKDAESSFNAAAVSVGTFMGNLALELLQKVTELIKNFAVGTAETGKTFEASMSKVEAISGATANELKDLDAVARQYGRDTQYSASECADALSYMALAGWDVEDMTAGLPGVLNLAVASQMDLAKASDVVTDYMTAFGWEANRAGEFADKMAFAMANSNTDTEMLGEAYKNCAATAESLHYSMEETTAAIMTMANAGVKGGEAGTALNAVMTRLATDTKGCASELKQYGIDIYDGQGNMQSLSSILTGISETWETLNDEQQANLAKMIAGQQQYSSFQTIMKGLSDTAKENGQSFNDYTNALLNCDGAATEMAHTMSDNLQGDLKKMESAYQDLQLSIYDGINAPLREVVQTITGDVLPAFSNLVNGVDGSNKEVGKAISKLISAILTKIKDLLPKMLPALSKSIRNLVEILARNFLSELPKLGYTLAKMIETLTQDFIPAFSKNLPKILTKFFSLIKKKLPAMLNSLKKIIKSLISGLKSVVSELLPGLLQTALQLLMNGIPLIISATLELLGAIVEALPDFLETLGTALPQVIDTITDFFSQKENLDKLKDTGKKILEKIANSIKDNIRVFKKKAPEIMEKIRERLKESVPKMTNIADKIITNIADGFGVSNKWQKLKDTFANIFSGVPDKAEEQFEIFKETVGEAFDRLKESADNLKEAVKNLFDRLKELFDINATDANSVITTIVDIAGAIASISIDAVSRAIEAVFEFLLWISGDSFSAETTRDTILGIVTAIATFETLNGAINIITNLPGMLSGLSGAFTGAWGVIVANPIVALIAALVGLIAVLVHVMKTSEEWQIGWQTIKDTWNGFIDSISEGYLIYEETFRNIKENISSFGENWKKFWEGYGEYLAEGIENFKTKIKEIPHKFQELIDGAKKWGEDFLTNFISGISENINPLHDTFESLGEWIYERFHFSTPDKGVLANSDTWFPDMMTNFANGISDNKNLVINQLVNLSDSMAEQAQNTGNRFLNGVLSITDKLPGNVGIHLTSTINNVIDWGKNLKQQADSAASDMVNAIENRIHSLPDRMTEVGQNLVQGLWNGIQGMKNWVLSHVSGFCNNILDSIFETFDIHSPAKTTVYVGKMLDYGVAGGVTENEDEPIKAIRQMANNLLNETAVIPERLPTVQQQYTVPDMQLPTINSALSDKLDRILQAIENGQVLMLDGNKLVGGTADRMNTALGQIQALSARR